MSDNNTMDWQLLDRYLAGESTPAETVFVEADPAYMAMVAAVRARPFEAGSDAAWQRLRASLGSSTLAARDVLQVPRRRTAGTASTWLSRAAVLTGVLIAAALMWRLTASGDRMLEASTGPALRDTVQLSDGSVVVLGPGSTLRYPRAFRARSRTVQLEGEAHFRVSADTSRPFEVQAANAIARVLGTQFTVRAYPGATEVEVLVSEGIVSLRAQGVAFQQAVNIAAGQRGRLRDGTVQLILADAEEQQGWLEGRLVMHDVTLSDAVQRIARWFDVDIVVADSSIARRRVTAAFGTAPLDQVLDALSLALGIRWQRTGRTITLRAEGAR